jgi:hypothetical protein
MKLVPRDVVTPECCPRLDVEYREEARVRCDLVEQPREIVKLECSSTLEEIQVLDPCTGCLTTIFKPVTVVKPVKKTVYDLVPTQVTFTMKVPVLVPVGASIPRRHLAVDCEPGTLVHKQYEGVVVPFTVKKDVPIVIPVCPE